MLKKNTANKIIIAAFTLSALFAASIALAQTTTSNVSSSTSAVKPLPVVFPITELGGCDSKEACRLYCNDTAHKEACFTYGQKHGLMTKDQVALARKLQIQVGPGGCKGEECKNYCRDIEHAQVCLEFAKTNGFISKDEALKRAERLKMASSTRPLPPIDLVGKNSSTTLLRKPEEKRIGTSTKPLLRPNASTTKPETKKEMPKPPLPTASSTTNASGGANIDYSKPPYHCTTPQAEEGACDPDQLPGYKPPPGSEQGGSIWFAILHFFGF